MNKLQFRLHMLPLGDIDGNSVLIALLHLFYLFLLLSRSVAINFIFKYKKRHQFTLFKLDKVSNKGSKFNLTPPPLQTVPLFSDNV